MIYPLAADTARTRAHALPTRINRPFWSREAKKRPRGDRGKERERVGGGREGRKGTLFFGEGAEERRKRKGRLVVEGMGKEKKNEKTKDEKGGKLKRKNRVLEYANIFIAYQLET